MNPLQGGARLGVLGGMFADWSNQAQGLLGGEQ